MEIFVGSRSSSLAKAQVQEVYEEIIKYEPSIEFKCLFIDTQGDKDQVTSLRTVGKTDFFTREIDVYLLEGKCRIAIHSAKDLPEPIPKGLAIAAITRSIDASDALVMRLGESLASLPAGAIVATSSFRREEVLKRLRPDLAFIDLRGTIEQRLAKLQDGSADAVVIAEAALIRLGLVQLGGRTLNRIKLPGETVKYQGQLAILTTQGDMEMRRIFQCIDFRQ